MATGPKAPRLSSTLLEGAAEIRQAAATLLAIAAQEWPAVRDSRDPARLLRFEQHFAGTYYADEARALREAVEAELGAKEETRRRILAEAEARKRVVAGFEAEGRIRVEAKIVHGAPRDGEAGWLKPGNGQSEWFKDHEQGPEMVLVPKGSFTMGSPAGEPERITASEVQIPVTIGEPFAIGRCAVTRGEFAAFVKATGYAMPGGAAYGWTGSEWKQDARFSWKNPGFPQDDRHPVVCVNWQDATAYVEWLAKLTGKPYRLPSEAEWEYASRAGATTPFWWGTRINPGQANYDGNSAYAESKALGAGVIGSSAAVRAAVTSVARLIRRTSTTLPVDYTGEQFRPNPWGLHQVHGNVWEWCADCWNDSNAGNPGDGSARTTGDCSMHVLRGGSWYVNPGVLRVACRFRDTIRYGHAGFRVCGVAVPPRTL